MKYRNRRVAGALVWSVLAAAPLAAQQTAQPVVAPQSTVPAPQEQPGAGAQVHTGTSSGLDAEARLENLLTDHQYLRIAAQLETMPKEQAQFYRGILANRSNDPEASIHLLEPLLDQVAASGDKPREKLLRKALAEDYLREGDWAKAAKAYQTLDTRLESVLSADEKDEIELPLKLLPLAVSHPPMTVEACDPFILQVSKNPLGLTDVPVFVDAAPHSWMLDPTAPFNLIARSLAREVGLKVSEESATVHTMTGRPIQVHTAVVPRFTIGGRLTLRNMTVFVFEDADYLYHRSGYQVQGVLGYAALSALGSLTFTDDDTIEVQPSKQPLPGEVAAAVESEKSAGADKTAAQTSEPTAGQPAKTDSAPAPVAATVPADAPLEPATAIPPSAASTPPAVAKVATSTIPQAPDAAPVATAKTAPALPVQGVPFFLDGDRIVVALGAADKSMVSGWKVGDERMFVVDAGSQQTYLTSRYYAEHADDFTGQKMELFAVPGSQSLPPQPAYNAETVSLPVGLDTMQIHFIQVLTQPLGLAALDDVYGVLGVDALEQLKSYTFDYRTMRFRVRPE